MRIRIRQRRELAVALPRWSTIGVAGGAALGALGFTLWRARRPRIGAEAERWLGGEG